MDVHGVDRHIYNAIDVLERQMVERHNYLARKSEIIGLTCSERIEAEKLKRTIYDIRMGMELDIF